MNGRSPRALSSVACSALLGALGSAHASAAATPPAGLLALDPTVANPPIAQRIPRKTEIHGYTRVDDYFWLRAKQDPEVLKYLHAETAYAEAVMKPTIPLQNALYDEILGHIKQTDLSVPYRLGAYYYYSRTEEGKQYPVYARKRASLDAPEEVTLDLNKLAAGREFLGLGAYQVSDDGNLLAYSIDTTGYRQYTLHVRDLRTRRDLSEAVERVDSVVWSSDGKTLFYVTEDPVSKRNDKLFRHKLGAVGSTLLYEEKDELYDIDVDRTHDRRYVLLGCYSKSTYETRYLRADRPSGAFRVLLPRREGHRYSVEHNGHDFYIVTNRNAEDFRLVTAPETAPGEANWKELVPERRGVHLSDIVMFQRYAVLRGRSGGFSNLEILDLRTGKLAQVVLPEAVHAVSPGTNAEYDTTKFRFAYQSLVTASSIYELDMASGARVLLKATEVPGYDPSKYATDLQYATATDGTKVPISIVYRKDRRGSGPAPMLLYGYGSYGVSTDPTFSAARLALLDRGVIYAIAHIRGGGELGEQWRTAGHLHQKLNTFTDFVDCAKYLIAQHFTSSDRLAIQGGSAGGLLMGAVTNMAPSVFKAVVAQVPFVDVMNTMLDPTLPLTTSQYLEWGNPNHKPDYDYMMRYSPYDNVTSQAYPAMLVKVSLNDSQVPYWEGSKLVAQLRARKTDANPLLLVVNFGAGHGGASGRYDALKETAFNYAFVLAEIAPER
jgi:oligopeptidase B